MTALRRRLKWALPIGVGAALGLAAPGWATIVVVMVALLVVRVFQVVERLR